MSSLFSISYLPPIPYIAACVNAKKIILEKHEHYVKQTHRNRALIYGANGILPLIIPVQHSDLFTVPIHAVKIAYDSPWQKIHWRSIVSAYRNAAFFEYYEDDFAGFYRENPATLFEFDLGLMNLIFRFIEADVDISFTSAYEKTVAPAADCRSRFDSARVLSSEEKWAENRYRQVFSAIHGFFPNISIVDLLFNEGPKSAGYLSLNYQ